jgi:hypothetical protein
MPQEERTVNELITMALYQANVFAVGEDIDSYAQQTGLEILNQLIDSFSAAGVYIPFSTQIDFNMVINQDIYTISDITDSDINRDRLSEITYASFLLSGQMPTPIRVIDDASYFNDLRLNSMATMPAYVFLDNNPLESRIIFYPKPDQAYPITLITKSFLNKLGLFNIITQVPISFHRFFRMHLVREFVDFYPSVKWTQKMEDDYKDARSLIIGVDVNMTLEPSTILEKNAPLIYPAILSST